MFQRHCQRLAEQIMDQIEDTMSRDKVLQGPWRAAPCRERIHQ